MDRLYFTSHTKIDVHFSKNSRDFVVDEVPLYEFSGSGEHLVVHIRKKDMTTWQLIQKISEVSGCKVRDIGYAGLKDKDGLTTQYVSLHKRYEKEIGHIEDKKIKILSKTYHNNKIRVGHLKGNKFFIRLKKVKDFEADKLTNILNLLQKTGMPNYFGYQRFGIDRDNYNIGREILRGEKKIKSRKKRDFFISAYQSHLFNLWLSKRVEISKLIEAFDKKELSNLFIYPKELITTLKKQKNFLKIFPGDILHHYPYGKAFECLELENEAKRFEKQEITLTGLLPGSRVKTATNEAGKIEQDFFSECDLFLDKMQGSRRFAWVFPKICKQEYKEEKGWYEISFFLPKGSYATVLLEELLHKRVDI